MNARVAALDLLCNCLALDRSSERNDTLRAAMASGEVNWPSVVEIANDQLLAPALWVALRARGLARELPCDVREYLRDLHSLNLDRNQGLKTQMLEAAQALNAVGVAPLLIKGAVTLFSCAYDDPGSRVMLDLDILVPRDAAQTCWDRLCTLGYLPIACARDFSKHHHLAPLYRPGAYGTIEVHRDALPAECERLLPTERIWNRSTPVNEYGIYMRVPDLSSQVSLNIIHSAVAHGGYDLPTRSMRSLHELALTADRQNAHIAWTEIRTDFQCNGKARTLDAWIYLSHRIFGTPKPGGLGDTLSARGYFARYRLQVRSRLASAFFRRLRLFSAHSIANRYGDDYTPRRVNAGRLRLLRELSSDYACRIARLSWRSLSRASV